MVEKPQNASENRLFVHKISQHSIIHRFLQTGAGEQFTAHPLIKSGWSNCTMGSWLMPSAAPQCPRASGNRNFGSFHFNPNRVHLTHLDVLEKKPENLPEKFCCRCNDENSDFFILGKIQIKNRVNKNMKSFQTRRKVSKPQCNFGRSTCWSFFFGPKVF